MFKIVLAMLGMLLFISVSAEASTQTVHLIVNGKKIMINPEPFLENGRVFVPIRFVTEELGATVDWDEQGNTVIICQENGDHYLKGQNGAPSTNLGIANNLIKAEDLKNILDDDKDNDLADYRQNHNGGDQIANDPLVVDVRKESDYDSGHIPGAIWIAPAENMAEPQSIKKLENLLHDHMSRGGKNEIVMYCYTGHTAGLLCGVLGAQGFSVKNLMYGYDIAWAGTKRADTPLPGAINENKDGAVEKCRG